LRIVASNPMVSRLSMIAASAHQRREVFMTVTPL
jgi:hypothetical protein